MVSKVYSITLTGIRGELVEVQTNITRGLPKFNIVGLPDLAIEEARARVKSAMTTNGHMFPDRVITVNLAPASVKKNGSGFDLAIALGVLQATNQYDNPELDECIVIGELGLAGQIEYVQGLLPMVMSGLNHGFKKFIIPKNGLREVAFLDEALFYPVEHIQDIIEGTTEIVPGDSSRFPSNKISTKSDITFEDIAGHAIPKRALIIALAGRHNVLMVGPPGSGKSALAKATRSIMSPLSLGEAIETTMLYSVAGLLNSKTAELMHERPFRSPHHTASQVSIIGGGAKPRPGEISLAHHGILFLDEFPEFSTKTLEVLRQPLEEKKVTITRAEYCVEFPSDFVLIAAMNPCSCGFLTDATTPCTCTIASIHKYKRKLSGPLLDRIDLFVDVPKLAFTELHVKQHLWNHNELQNTIEETLHIQKERYKSQLIFNGNLSAAQCRKYCECTKEAEEVLHQAMKTLHLTGRAYFRLLKVARTLADLDRKDKIDAIHMQEAIQFRCSLLQKEYL
jgi:magnesium chelatase family protein